MKTERVSGGSVGENTGPGNQEELQQLYVQQKQYQKELKGRGYCRIKRMKGGKISWRKAKPGQSKRWKESKGPNTSQEVKKKKNQGAVEGGRGQQSLRRSRSWETERNTAAEAKGRKPEKGKKCSAPGASLRIQRNQNQQVKKKRREGPRWKTKKKTRKPAIRFNHLDSSGSRGGGFGGKKITGEKEGPSLFAKKIVLTTGGITHKKREQTENGTPKKTKETKTHGR